MNEDCEMKIDILLDSDASATEVSAIEEIARQEGIHGSIQATYSQRSWGEVPWVVFLLASINLFFAAFIAEAGKDSYQGIRRLVSRLFKARRNSHGNIVVSDDDSGTTIVLSEDLPGEAYTQLAQKGLQQIRGGYWTWDAKANTWNRF